MDFERLKKDSESVSPKIDKNASYIQAYPEFVRYFRDLDSIEKHHFFIGTHFVYGWMPRMLTLKIQELKRVLEILNSVKKSEDILNIHDLEMLKECINRSMVGTSKLLHFINPKKYAIGDSRVLRYLNESGNYWQIERPKDYLAYLAETEKIANTAGYSVIHALIEERCGYPIEPTRAIEMIMYETDRNK